VHAWASVVAHSFPLLLEQAGRFLREHARDGEVLVIGHTRVAAEDFVRGACGGALAGAHPMALRELAGLLARRRLIARGTATLTALAREALAARTIAQTRPLRYFDPVADMPGFPRALAATLEELRMERIGAAQLADAGPAAADLARLLDAYTRELAHETLADSAAIYAAATEALRRRDDRWCGLPAVLLAPALPHAAERAFVQALIEQSPRVFAAELPAGGSPPEPPASAIRSLQAFLFAPGEPPPQADASVSVFSASGEALECVEIARRIAAAGVPFDDTAILLRDPARYGPLVQEALRRASIPAWFARGVERPEPAGRAFLALLVCAAEDFSAARFAGYLSLRQVPETGPGPVSANRWERLLADAGVIGGKDRWERRLRGLANEIRFRDRRGDPSGERRREQSAELDRLLKFALPLIERLDALPRAATWGQWLEALHALADHALREPAPVHAVLEDLAPLAGVGPVQLPDVLRTLRASLGDIRQPVSGNRYGRVFVAPIEDARGMSFALVFIPGLVEGGFPRPVRQDPLLLDDARRSISPELATSRDGRERALLRAGVAAARDSVVLSYPRIEPLTGRERVPSLYAYDALRAARGSAFRPQELQAEARANCETTLAWPAPRHPENAIDDAEFDLSMLRPLLERGEAGAAAYLTRVNPHLLGALRARGRRWRRAWFAADGLLDLDIEALEMLAEHRLSRRAYSPSALEQFAVCPYRFALRAILRLRPLERPAPLERMSAALRGEIFHRVQFELLRALETRKLLPVSAATLEAACAELDRVMARAAARYAEDLAPAIPRVWAAEMETIRVDLRGWLAENARISPDWTPVACELGFGIEPDVEHDGRSAADPVACAEGVLLRGSIDLVERHPSGVLRVTDHKTGAPPSPAPLCVGGGEALQPVLYAIAAEKLLQERVALGRYFYATLRANYRALPIPVNDANRRRVEQVLQVIDGAVDKGAFPAAPKKDACARCEYLPLCGPYEEERAGRKAQAELRALKELRTWA
jgi:RecB family exonuclease